MDKILFTIITVCYQAEKEIENTIRSILSQDSTNYEYLIIDGASTDKTMKIVERYRKAFRERGISYRIVSEKDTGIYCAMNKGIDLAEGEYLNFMNAGDCFASAHVLSDVGNLCRTGEYEVIFGDTVLTEWGLFKSDPARPIDTISTEIPFCHQSAFEKTSSMKLHHYDEHFSVCADYDYFAKLYCADNTSFTHIQLPISIFALGGLSTTAHYKLLREQAEIRMKYGFIDTLTYQRRISELNDEEESISLPKAPEHGLHGIYRLLMPDWIRNFRYRSVQKKKHLSSGWVKKNNAV